MSAYHFLAIIVILIIFVIALWRQSGILFIVTALAGFLLGLLGRLETWEVLIIALICGISLISGVIKLVRGEF